MPKYVVPLYEGNKITKFRVEAESEEEAVEKATAFRNSPERFEAINPREKVAAEQQAARQALSDAEVGQALAPAVGVAQSFVDLAGGAADSILNMAEGLATVGAGTHFGQEAVQAVRNSRNKVREKAIDWNSASQEWITGRPLTQEEKIRVAQDTNKFVKRGKFATDAATGMATGAATLAAKSLPRMMMLGAAEGGLGGWLMADTEEDMSVADAIDRRAGEATIGAVLGTGLSVVPGLFATAKNYLGRKVTRAGGGAENIAAIRGDLNRLGIHRASPGQITGDPDLIRAEFEAAGGEAQGMLREQAEQATQGLGRAIGIQLPPTAQLLKGGREAIRNVMDLTNKALGKMRGRRNTAFQDAMQQIEDITGGKPVIRTDKFVNEFNNVIKQISHDYGEHIPLGGALKSLANMVNRASARGGLTALEANVVLKRLQAIKSSGRGMFDFTSPEIAANAHTFSGHSQTLAKQLKDVLEESFDDSVSSLGGRAGSLLKDARAAYSSSTRGIAQLEDDFRRSVGINGTPARILENLRTADPDTARTFVKALRTMEGGQQVIDDLNTHLFRQAVNDASAARAGAPHRLGDFDLKVFTESLMQNTEASRLAGLLTESQEKNLVAGAQSIRRLLNITDNIQRTHLPFELQNIAINVISRDPGFMSRLIAAGIQKGHGAEQLFFTEAGQDFLFDAVNQAIRAQKTGAVIQGANATVATFASMLGTQEQLRKAYEWVNESEQNVVNGQ